MSNGQEEDDGFVVRIRGLPWAATYGDVNKFFGDSQIKGGQDGVKFTFTKDGRASGEAFVEFAGQKDMDNAFKKHNKAIEHRYIEVYRSTRGEMNWVTERAGKNAIRPREGQCVKLRGLPYSCKDADIVKFFEGLEIAPHGITILKDFDGQNSGEAFVRFASTEAVEAAMQKHKEKIGHRYIEIFSSSPEEVKNANMNVSRRPQRPGPYDRIPPPMMGYGFPGRGMGRFKGPYGGYGGGYGDFGGFGGYSGGFMGYGGFGGPDPGMMGKIAGPRGRGMGGGGFGGWMGGGGNERRGYAERGGAMGGGGGGSGGGGSSRTGSDYHSSTGHHVHMRGLPFAATQRDITEFFQTASVTPSKITLCFNDAGRKNGEANVEFATFDEAQAAMAKNKEHIGPRYIELFLHSRSGNSPGGAMGRRSMGFEGDMDADDYSGAPGGYNAEGNFGGGQNFRGQTGAANRGFGMKEEAYDNYGSGGMNYNRGGGGSGGNYGAGMGSGNNMGGGQMGGGMGSSGNMGDMSMGGGYGRGNMSSGGMGGSGSMARSGMSGGMGSCNMGGGSMGGGMRGGMGAGGMGTGMGGDGSMSRMGRSGMGQSGMGQGNMQSGMGGSGGMSGVGSGYGNGGYGNKMDVGVSGQMKSGGFSGGSYGGGDMGGGYGAGNSGSFGGASGGYGAQGSGGFYANTGGSGGGMMGQRQMQGGGTGGYRDF